MGIEIARECVHANNVYIPHPQVANGQFYQWYFRQAGRPVTVGVSIRRHKCIEPECGTYVTKSGCRCKTHANAVRRAKLRANAPALICALCGAPRNRDICLCRAHANAYYRARSQAKKQNQKISVALFIAQTNP